MTPPRPAEPAPRPAGSAVQTNPARTRPAEVNSAGRHLRALLVQSWRAFHPRAALYCIPALAGVLAIGLAIGQPGPAILVAAGAFSTGFGAFQRFTRLHVAPMLLAALGMGVSMAVGTVAANAPVAEAFCVGAAALVLGLAASLGTGLWWAMLQGAIFLVVASSTPGDLTEGLNRALLVLGGGLVQCASVAILRALAPGGFPPLSPPTATPSPETREQWAAAVRSVFRPGSPELGYGLLLGAVAALAILVAHGLGLKNGYWVPMTVLLVLRRGGGETVTRGVLRMGGTLAGAGAATLIAALLRPEPPTLVALIAGAAWSAYALQWVNYGTFSISVTSYIAFLLSLEGLPETVVASHRVAATLLGGALALAGMGIAKLLRLAARPFV